MNYVILNGVKSNTVKGLLIQSLPPISKPLMRTQVETIDGRDGDIVTNLGYSAYDKAVTIGLCGDYNVDDVIRFFDSAGTVIFSNEPDKFYNYQIVGQIDFERLLRFKTATVTFHVQPFKYSAIENSYEVNNDFLTVKNYSATKNGITVTAENGLVTVTGTGLTATEFYVPIESVSLTAGNYVLSAITEGTTANVCSIRLIGSAPSNADSFGGNYLPLQSNGTATLNGAVAEGKVYGYLWFYMNANGAMNFTLNPQLANSNFNSVTVVNRGNTKARPIITLYGSGTINLSINGMQAFVINLGNAEYMTIDAVAMNAYQGELLLNRNVTGSYDNLILNVGTNTISWTGTITGIEIENFSRWI